MEDNNTLTIDKDILVSAIANTSKEDITIDWNNKEVSLTNYPTYGKLTFNDLLIKFITAGRKGLYK